MPDLCIKSDGVLTHIVLDGKEIQGVQSCSFEHNLNEAAFLNLKFCVPGMKFNDMQEDK